MSWRCGAIPEGKLSNLEINAGLNVNLTGIEKTAVVLLDGSPTATLRAATGFARYVGRVGALAVALGIGAAVATSPGVAVALPDSSGSTESSSGSESTGAQQDSTPDTNAPDTNTPDTAAVNDTPHGDRRHQGPGVRLGPRVDTRNVAFRSTRWDGAGERGRQHHRDDGRRHHHNQQSERGGRHRVGGHRIRVGNA